MAYLNKKSGFTIVELLVVIVVIGILVTITIVSYTGISQRATAATLQSDLTGAANKLKMYQVEYGSYPTMAPDGNGGLCPSSPSTEDTKYCIKPSPGNIFTYRPPGILTFYLTAKDLTNTNEYVVTNDTTPVPKISLVVSDPTNWISIGTQVWAKYNLNVGTRVTGTTAQSNNTILEKYCFANNESNCTNYGALYQWDEAMQYITTEGVQGICPTGSHFPSDNDWKILEMQLGMSQAQADGTGYRGVNQGTQIKPGGASGLNIPLAGARSASGGGTFIYQTINIFIWSSSESSVNAWSRIVLVERVDIARTTSSKVGGYSVRCVGN